MMDRIDRALAALPHPRTATQAEVFKLLRASAYRAATNWRWIVVADPCSYCNTRNRKRTREHVVPASLGGQRHYENIVGACGVCQRGRGNVPFLRYYLAARVVRQRGVATRRIANGEIRGAKRGAGFGE